MNKRIGYIDIAKGLGILVIVLAHNDLAGYHPTLHKFIYAFHIPLFFFLSGMFFRPERAFGETVRRRFNTLMKPYFFALFLIYLGEAAFSNMTFPVIAGRIAKAMYATGKYIDWVQLWFIPHLFAVSLFAWIAWRFALWPREMGLASLAPAVRDAGRGRADHALFLAVHRAHHRRRILWTAVQPRPRARERIFLPRGLRSESASAGKVFRLALVLAGTFGLLLSMVVFLPALLDFNTRTYPSLWINTAEALLGIGMILSLARNLERWSERLANVFRYFGRISLVILIFHVPIQETLFDKFTRLGLPTDPSIALAFLSGVLIPALIYELAIHRNPRLRPWFGFAAEEQVVEEVAPAPVQPTSIG